MKLLNYDSRTLIYQNLRCNAPKVPPTFTKRQYTLLCKLIRQKGVTKQFFDVLLTELYGLDDWRKLNYEQMYEIIHILTFWNYRKEN